MHSMKNPPPPKKKQKKKTNYWLRPTGKFHRNQSTTILVIMFTSGHITSSEIMNLSSNLWEVLSVVAAAACNRQQQQQRQQSDLYISVNLHKLKTYGLTPQLNQTNYKNVIFLGPTICCGRVYPCTVAKWGVNSVVRITRDRSFHRMRHQWLIQSHVRGSERCSLMWQICSNGQINAQLLEVRHAQS